MVNNLSKTPKTQKRETVKLSFAEIAELISDPILKKQIEEILQSNEDYKKTLCLLSAKTPEKFQNLLKSVALDVIRRKQPKNHNLLSRIKNGFNKVIGGLFRINIKRGIKKKWKTTVAGRRG